MQDKNYYIKLQNKLKSLPIGPGVYFHKDKNGNIIYVGKAAVLKNRVRQYFQSSKTMDAKTKTLVADIYDTDWVQTDSEIDALFLEAEMVKRYMPKYNILLRDDKSLIYIRIDMNSQWPFVSYTRNPADDGAEYFGPYFNSFAIKKAMRYLRRIFPYYDKPVKLDYRPTKLQRSRAISEKKTLLRQGFVGLREPKMARLDLDAHLGLSPVNMTSAQYKANLRKLISYINGNRKKITNEIKQEMKKYAKFQDFENAAKYRNKLNNLRELQLRIMFGDKEFLDISKDAALCDLTDLLGLQKIPVRIEGFDISHMSGTNVVASMVVFKNGVSERNEYRKFKTHFEQNNDFYNMNEVIARRFSEKNVKSWGLPNLVLIDGGKGQLEAAQLARDKCGQTKIPFIGLAKRDEQIIIHNYPNTSGPAAWFAPNSPRNSVAELGAAPPNVTRGSIVSINYAKVDKLNGSVETSDDFITINLPNSTNIIKLLQRIRDESHRFAVSYHTVIKKAKQTASLLDEVAGVGPKTRSKLIRKFGSIRGIKSASESDLAAIVGKQKAKQIIANL